MNYKKKHTFFIMCERKTNNDVILIRAYKSCKYYFVHEYEFYKIKTNYIP